MDHTTWTDQTLSASVEVVDQEAAATDIKTDEAAATDVPILMGMDLDVFNAAKEGKIDVLRGHDPQHLNQILTPTSNTVLHLVVVDLEHGAAAFALSSSAEEEAACWKIFIRTPSKEKDTALHQAVRFKHLGVVEILIKEDPDFSYPPNVAGETPLYLAAERRYKALFSEILGTCKHPTYQGPIGRTALHAAVIHGDEGSNVLLNAKDVDGHTPLHLLNAPLYTGTPFYPERPFIGDDRVDKMAFNKENMNALDVIEANDYLTFEISLKHALKRNGAVSGHRILRENDHDGQKLIKENKGGEDTELDKNIRESHLIVATLVATVTFTAGVTMPGGYYQSDASGGNAMSKVSNQNVMAPAPAPIRPSRGYAVLTKNAAFQIFFWSIC
ncbi:hypothetical protein Pyn_33892 [Prunus yedoensis var. nudiflora]|uniref:PGG domain-containing protein n=1 Tax=Prunus yedoensis var. nudiflora TaxID=2094558 RepID=A0A314Y8B0_PRUYE|nr:hypothetical protein Pyn_33892 [Prunus yedoensis var. nudiflora]